MANWFQLPPQTPKSVRLNISAKTLVCLPLRTKIIVIKYLKLVPGKLTGVFLKKTQKVVYMTWKHDLNPMFRKNTLVLKHILLLLACPLFLPFLAMASLPLLCIQCLKSASDVIVCSKQIKYHTCEHCNRLYKPCLEVWPNRFWYA